MKDDLNIHFNGTPQFRKIWLRLAQRVSRIPSYEPLLPTKLITSNVCTNRTKYLCGGNAAKTCPLHDFKQG